MLVGADASRYSVISFQSIELDMVNMVAEEGGALRSRGLVQRLDQKRGAQFLRFPCCWPR
ncbi:hypothetical protein DPM35_01180 [Mesorhizobium atlanticum]|uniref:Uncharacterized protein n=1 Tax=Mesorhizobium atlanticum TaxID=2233532 RepID=A0A330H206_9HYPH|nr:hypothetical protein DPM35_01180 [Mesorhizobium atlanticum]